MDKIQALQNLLEGTATEDDIVLLKRLLANGEISIGGNVNQSVIIIGSGNTVELPPAALDRLNARPMLGNLDRDLTGEEIASGLRRLDKLLPNRAPVLLPHYKEQVGRLRPSLKTEKKSLSETSRRERIEALAAINSICVEALDVSFNGLCLGEEVPKYDARSPFRGLESFRPEDSEFFFGREALTQKLVRKIKAHSFLAVLGASGSGKSSLVMAGVLPALDSDYMVFRPGTNPLGELESTRGKSLIVVDQFEELFTLTRDESTRKDFIVRLLDFVTSSRIILTLRSDFLGEVGAYRTLSAEIQSHLEIIPPMDMDELLRAMEGQAGVVGLRFEADLSQQILDDVAGEPGAMPLLQHALWELWNRRHGRNLRASEYRAFGGVKQAITSTAEKVYADCSKSEQDQVRDIFLRLTRLDDSDEGRDTRRRVPLGDLIPSGRDAPSITLLLDKLANARLIVKTVNEDKTEVEVAHEALIRHWERLQIWLNEDRDALRLRESVSEDARRWENASRDESMLNHRGGRLDDAMEIGEDSRYGVTVNEQAYLSACVALRNREQRERERRRKFTLASVFAVTVTIMAILVGWSISSTNSANVNATQVSINSTQVSVANTTQANAEIEKQNAQQQEKIARARELASASNFERVSGSLDLALLLGVEATKKSEIFETRDALLQSIQASPRIQSFIAYEVSVSSVAFSSDGKVLASGSIDGSINLWDMTNPKLPRLIAGPFKSHTNKITALSFNRLGTILASGSLDNTIVLWDVSDVNNLRKIGNSLVSPIEMDLLLSNDFGVNCMSFSSDGKILASGSLDSVITLWDVSTPSSPYIIGEPITDLFDRVWSIAISPDNITLAVGYSSTEIALWNISSPDKPKIMSRPKPSDVAASGEAYGQISLAFSADGKIMATGTCVIFDFFTCYKSKIRLWDMGDPSNPFVIGEVPIKPNGDVQSLIFSPDNNFLISGSKEITVWDITNPSLPEEFGLTPLRNGVNSLAIDPKGKLLVSGNLNGLIVQDISLSNTSVDILGTFLETTSQGTNISMSDWGTRLYTRWSISSIALSPDERFLVAGGCNNYDEYTCVKGGVRVWDLRIPSSPILMDNLISDMSYDINSVAFNPKGNILALGSNGVAVYDFSDPENPTLIAQMLDAHANFISSLSFQSDGKVLASASADETIILWDMENPYQPKIIGAPIENRHDVVWDIKFSPDNNLLAAGTKDGIISLWDVSNINSPKELAQIKTTGGSINSLAFTLEGDVLIVGNENSKIQFWNISQPEEPTLISQPIGGHSSWIQKIVQSPFDNLIASGGTDSKVILWDISELSNPRILGEYLSGYSYPISDLSFSKEGETLISAGSDGTIIIWQTGVEKWKDIACQRAGRNLTNIEWVQYFPNEPYPTRQEDATCPQWTLGLINAPTTP